MPLLDHFHSPLREERHWQGMHSAWANALVTQLNDTVLPEEYFAEPHVKLGMAVEVDVATWEEGRLAEAEQTGGVALAVYAPPAPALTFPVSFSELDTFEIQIRQEGAMNLVAAIELVSPANKDRPAHRQAFVRKCATYLQQGVSVLVVDIVTERSGNLHLELVEELAPQVTIDWDDDNSLYAVSYRARPSDQVEVWPECLSVGQALPKLPLWISDSLAIPVELERSYVAACKALRIRTSD